MFRQIYFEACDLHIGKLNDQFNQDFMAPLIAAEGVIIKSANGEDFTVELSKINNSIFGKDLDFPKLNHQLAMLNDIIHQTLPEVKKVTSIRTVCSTMASSNYSHKSTFNEIHHLLRFYLTVPIKSATSERAFSTLRRIFTYLRSSLTEKRLNNCILLHIYKD